MGSSGFNFFDRKKKSLSNWRVFSSIHDEKNETHYYFRFLKNRKPEKKIDNPRIKLYSEDNVVHWILKDFYINFGCNIEKTFSNMNEFIGDPDMFCDLL